MDSDRPMRALASTIHEYKGLSLIHATKQQDDVELFRSLAGTEIAAIYILFRR